MTKMRVHELAKELEMNNKDLMDMLTKNNIEVKSHMSSLEAEVVDNIKKNAKGSKPPREVHEGKAAKSTEVVKAAETAEDTSPKKKHIVQVFRPQNSIT